MALVSPMIARDTGILSHLGPPTSMPATVPCTVFTAGHVPGHKTCGFRWDSAIWPYSFKASTKCWEAPWRGGPAILTRAAMGT